MKPKDKYFVVFSHMDGWSRTHSDLPPIEVEGPFSPPVFLSNRGAEEAIYEANRQISRDFSAKMPWEKAQGRGIYDLYKQRCIEVDGELFYQASTPIHHGYRGG